MITTATWTWTWHSMLQINITWDPSQMPTKVILVPRNSQKAVMIVHQIHYNPSQLVKYELPKGWLTLNSNIQNSMLYSPSVMYMTVRYSCWWDCMCRFISPELGIGCTRFTPLLYGRVNNTFLLSGIMRCNVNRTWNTKIVVTIHNCVMVWCNQKHLMFCAIRTIRVRRL